MPVAAVVPTCRGFVIPEQTIPVHWIIVHDVEKHAVVGDEKHITHIVAPDARRYGERCDSIRSAGFLEAYRNGFTEILTVDDDCLIPPNWAEQHRDALRQHQPLWSKTFEGEHPPRGYPIHPGSRAIAISHGLWDGVPDISGHDQLKGFDHIRHTTLPHVILPPFPQSAMNLGFNRVAASVMYQPAQGPSTPYDRFADIWGGLLAQRVLSLHNFSFLNSTAIVYHKRASDAQTNADKERSGRIVHEGFWRHVWKFNRRGDTLAETYALLAANVADFGTSPYFASLAENMLHWVEQVQGSTVAS